MRFLISREGFQDIRTCLKQKTTNLRITSRVGLIRIRIVGVIYGTTLWDIRQIDAFSKLIEKR